MLLLAIGINEWVAILAAVGSGGIVVTTLKYLFQHAKVHQGIEDDLARGADRFERVERLLQKNDVDHAMIMKKVEATCQALRELLVHEGLREPGQSINGEDK